MIFRPLDDKAASICSELFCDSIVAIGAPLEVTWVISVGLTMVLTVGYVEEGIETCQEERDYLAAERGAFQTFLDRIRSVDPIETDSRATALTDLQNTPHTTLANRDPGDATFKYVISAYKETVLSLPHYRKEYNETLAESLTAELGQDIVTALATNKTLVPATQQALIERSQQAITSRTNLIEAITAEIDALTETQADLNEIETRRHNLRTHLDATKRNQSEAAFDVLCTLRNLKSEADDIAKSRQKRLQNAPIKKDTTATSPVEPIDFYEYLHGKEGTPRYPVLSAVAELGSDIRTDQQQVMDYM